ncbi:efflux RND transporter periplasmic adaptor subunit [Desulfovibrio sp. DS-1]|nr:efflux RND transporter periplasmic adaptor subunit [Desulfovibrio sp. DS-1]
MHSFTRLYDACPSVVGQRASRRHFRVLAACGAHARVRRWRLVSRGLLPLAVLLGATLLLAGCGESSPTASSPRTVRAATVLLTEREAVACRAFPATVRARRVVTLAAKGPGAVGTVYAEEGALLAPGTPILQVDDTELAERVAATRSERQAAERQRDAVAARLAYAAANLARTTELVRTGGVSRDDFDRATAEHGSLREEAAALEGRIAALRHQEREQEATRGYSRVTSPVHGVLARRLADAGTFVAAGQVLAQVDDLSGPVDLVAAVDEGLLPLAHPDQPVLVEVPALVAAQTTAQTTGPATGPVSGPVPVQTAQSPQPPVAPQSVRDARVAAVVASVDAATRTFTLKAQLPRDMVRAGARTGMFGRVLLPTGRESRLLLPAAAVVRRGDLDVVFVADAGGVLRLRPVRLGQRWYGLERPDGLWLLPLPSGDGPGTPSGALLEVTAGLAPGDRVVVDPAPDLADGDRLAVQG